MLRFAFTQVTQVQVHIFKTCSREKSSEDERVRFVKRNELKVTQVEILSFFIFMSVSNLFIGIF